MMAYQNNYVVSLLHKDRPVREFSENGERTCTVPFGSEYKIRLKNKTHKRCKVKVFIDGMDTNSDGSGFILNAYQSFDLERFVDDLQSGRKFKFISVEEGTRTGEIQDPTSSENGLIRVEFHPEKEYWWNTLSSGTITITNSGCWCKLTGCLCNQGTSSYYTTCSNGATSYMYSPSYANAINTSNTVFVNSGTTNVNCNSTPTSFQGATFSSLDATNSVSNNCSYNASTSSQVLRSYKSVEEQTKGATVQGGQSSQSFVTVSDFATDAPTTITLKMRGPKSEAPRVQVPVHQPAKPFEVRFKENLITVSHDGSVFVSSSHAKISLTNEGLSIEGNGISIKSKDYVIVKA